MSFPTPANHPRTCRICEGTGWQEAPSIHSQAAGQPCTYTMLIPCTHHWTDDQPTLLDR